MASHLEIRTAGDCCPCGCCRLDLCNQVLKADINTHSQKQLVSAKNVSPSRSDQFCFDLRDALPRVRFCFIKRTASLI